MSLRCDDTEVFAKDTKKDNDLKFSTLRGGTY